MANLLATLQNSASALDAYDRVLEVTQNNVVNASTPGYVRLSLPLQALAFDPAAGLSGGVLPGNLQSARDEYAEQAVRRHNTALGAEQQTTSSLSSLQPIFDISGNSGIPNALNRFFQSASAWGQSPNSTAARQTVIDRATELAQSFQSAAGSLQTLAQDTESQLRGSVDHVNQLVAQIRTYNQAAMQIGSGSADLGMDSQVHATLEQLAQLVSFTATRQTDGTTSILLNGATPLLIGDRQYSIQIAMQVPATPPPVNANPPASARLLASDGADITARTTDGQLGALLDIRNRVLPSYTGDAYQAGDLNRMAQEFADRINAILTGGHISDGPPPVMGAPLFQYDGAHPTSAAQTLTVAPSFTPALLAAIEPGPPYVSNGVPLALSQMATPTDILDEIDGVSYSEFYGQMAANIGSLLQSAQDGQQVQQSLVAQARNLRHQISGVSLDAEAMTLVEFQRAYQANSRFITVLDELTQETINILR